MSSLQIVTRCVTVFQNFSVPIECYSDLTLQKTKRRGVTRLNSCSRCILTPSTRSTYILFSQLCARVRALASYLNLISATRAIFWLTWCIWYSPSCRNIQCFVHFQHGETIVNYIVTTASIILFHYVTMKRTVILVLHVICYFSDAGNVSHNAVLQNLIAQLNTSYF